MEREREREREGRDSQGAAPPSVVWGIYGDTVLTGLLVLSPLVAYWCQRVPPEQGPVNSALCGSEVLLDYKQTLHL